MFNLDWMINQHTSIEQHQILENVGNVGENVGNVGENVGNVGEK